MVVLAGLLAAAACSTGDPNANLSVPSATTTEVTTATPLSTMTSPTISPSSSVTTQPSTTTTADTAVASTFVVFMPRQLPDDFGDRATQIDGLGGVGLIHTETLHIVETRTAEGIVVDQPGDGFVIPVQGAHVDPTNHAAFLAPALADLLTLLGPDQVLLSESSAALRGIGSGGTIILDSGRVVEVRDIVPDTAFGAEEVVTTDPKLVGGVGSELRFAVVQYPGSADELRVAMLDVLPDGAGFGVHPRGHPADQTTAVRSQVWIKQTFGEFAYRPSGGGRFTVDPAWLEANIIIADIPLLGSVRCHRRYVELLAGVMTALVASGDQDAVDRGAFFGCWNARYVANSMRLSRHAWGAAADINFFNSLDGGAGSPINPRLLEAMSMAGITSGHDWSIPDPGHFEYYGFPEDE